MLRQFARKVGIGKLALQSQRLVTGEWQRERAQRRAAQEQQEDVQRRIAESRSYFASIKGKFAGRRGFVIGNGPSLRISDLDMLQGEICIASNKIYLAYDQTAWRPSYVTIGDPLVWEKVGHGIGQYVPEIVMSSMLPKRLDCSSRIRVVQYLGSALDGDAADGGLRFSNDMCSGVYSGYTVTFENLQLAMHLGLNPIYIIGCDHYYRGEEQVVPNQVVKAPSVSNHFLPNYRSEGEIVNPAPIELMNTAYRIARRFGDRSGVQIFNATRGGYLEAFSRADFERVVSKS